MTPRPTFTIPLPDGRTLQLGERTLVMGILNVTPDSFADAGLHLDPGAAEAAAAEMEASGADLIDVGGESTRPGAGIISPEEEIARIQPVLKRLARTIRVPVSVDTSKAAVAEMALDEGPLLVGEVAGVVVGSHPPSTSLGDLMG